MLVGHSLIFFGETSSPLLIFFHKVSFVFVFVFLVGAKDFGSLSFCKGRLFFFTSAISILIKRQPTYVGMFSLIADL